MKEQNFYGVERGLLENSILNIRETVVPQSNMHIRTSLSSAIGKYNERNGEFKVLTARQLSDQNSESFNFLIEVPASACPEFVLEYMKNPFIKRIDPEEIAHHPLDKSQYSSILKISTSMTRTLWRNLKETREPLQVVKDFRVDFFISPEAFLVEPAEGDSLLHVLLTFNVNLS